MNLRIEFRPNPEQKLNALKHALSETPAGPKKDAARKHYAAAETAMAAKDDCRCIQELDAAVRSILL